jgi:hypothetical protein
MAKSIGLAEANTSARVSMLPEDDREGRGFVTGELTDWLFDQRRGAR